MSESNTTPEAPMHHTTDVIENEDGTATFYCICGEHYTNRSVALTQAEARRHEDWNNKYARSAREASARRYRYQ